MPRASALIQVRVASAFAGDRDELARAMSAALSAWPASAHTSTLAVVLERAPLEDDGGAPLRVLVRNRWRGPSKLGWGRAIASTSSDPSKEAVDFSDWVRERGARTTEETRRTLVETFLEVVRADQAGLGIDVADPSPRAVLTLASADFRVLETVGESLHRQLTRAVGAVRDRTSVAYAVEIVVSLDRRPGTARLEVGGVVECDVVVRGEPREAATRIANQLSDVLAERAPRFVTRVFAEGWLFSTSHSAVVDAAIEAVGMTRIASVVRRLAEEGAAFDPAAVLLQALLEFERTKLDTRTAVAVLRAATVDSVADAVDDAQLGAFVRQALGAYTAGRLSIASTTISVVILDGDWTPELCAPAMGATRADALLAAYREAVAAEAVDRAVVLTSATAIANVREALRFEFPLATVVGYDELPSHASLLVSHRVPFRG